MKYAIKVEEILSRTVIIDAESESDALDKVQNIYTNGGIVLDYDDFFDGNIISTGRASESELRVFEEVTEE